MTIKSILYRYVNIYILYLCNYIYYISSLFGRNKTISFFPGFMPISYEKHLVTIGDLTCQLGSKDFFWDVWIEHEHGMTIHLELEST